MAYTVAVTYDQRSAAKFGNGGFKIIAGSANISVYDSTKPVSIITNEFRTLLREVCDCISTLGFVVRWDATAKQFKCFIPNSITPPSPLIVVAYESNTIVLNLLSICINVT